MFKLDMHSHTKGSDGTSTPEEIARCAKDAGLDGLCLTDHHTNTPEDNAEVHRVAKALEAVGVRAFIGVEYSTSVNHLLIFGIDVPNGAWGMYPDTQEVIDEVNAMGGACVIPHPYKVYQRAAEDKVKKLRGLAAIEGYNGQVEVKNPVINAKARGAAAVMGLPMTGGSDAHWASMIGVVWTEFDRDITDDLDLAAALKEGNFRPGVNQLRIGEKQSVRDVKLASYPRGRRSSCSWGPSSAELGDPRFLSPEEGGTGPRGAPRSHDESDEPSVFYDEVDQGVYTGMVLYPGWQEDIERLTKHNKKE